MGFLKKAFNFVKKTVQTVIDPIINIGIAVVKAVISPFTGAFDLPDISIDAGYGSDTIKAATTVDFNGANRAIPVLYGNRIETATIPVFVGTHGDNSADTSKQYLYMAAIISQGFHGSNQEVTSNGAMGSLLSRMTIDSKPVNLNTLLNTINPNYTLGAGGATNNAGGIFASGLGGTQPAQHTIGRGTFANRLKIQYFDGSSDQPASSLLREHPDWDDDQNTLSGMHYVALRFELKSANEVITGGLYGDGDGTYGNPYNSIPAVVVTVSGKSTPNLMSGKNDDPGYEERFHTSYSEKARSTYMSYHRPLNSPDYLGALASGETPVVSRTYTVGSDTSIELRRFLNYHPTKYSNGSLQDINIHDILFNFGWTSDYVFFYPSTITGAGATTTYGGVTVSNGDANYGIMWLKHVGAGHYQFVSKVPADVTIGAVTGTLTFFGYNDTAGNFEERINATYPGENLGSDTAEYRFYAPDWYLQTISNKINAGNDAFLRVRHRASNTNDLYTITSALWNSANNFITVGIVNDDSSKPADAVYTTVPVDSEIYIEIADGSANTDKFPATWDISFANGYKVDGLTHEGYRCDTNVIEYIVDYLLNPNYGVGMSIDQIDKQNFISASIAMDRIPNAWNFDSTIFYMGRGSDTYKAPVIAAYMYGENAVHSLMNGYIVRTSNNSYDRQFKIDTTRTFIENINIMLSSVGAYMTYVDGKFKIQIENAGDLEDSERILPITALPIAAKITDDEILEGVGISTTAMNDRFNQIKLDYTDLTNNSQPASILTPDPVDDSTDIRQNYLNEDNGKILETSFSAAGIFDPVTAKRYATLLLKKSRGQPRVDMQVSPLGIRIIPGDFIRIDSSVLGINDVYRVTDVIVNPDNTIVLNAIRHIPDFYDITDTGQVFEAQRPVLE